MVTIAGALLLFGCRSARSAESGAPAREVWAAREPDEFGPGFDIVWLGSPADHRHVELAEDYVFWVDATRQAWIGASFAELSPLSFKVTGGVVSTERGVVYSLHERSFFRQRQGGKLELLWTAPWEIDQITEDSAAFFALLLDCRSCVPKHREQVWRIPKKLGTPSLFFSVESTMVTRLHSDGDTLYLHLLRYGERESQNLEIAIRGGNPGPPEPAAVMPQLSDQTHRYEIVDRNLFRVQKRDGARQRLGPWSRKPLAVDAADLIYLEVDELYALAKSGGTPRLLADWSGKEFRSCDYCGSTREAVCLSCGEVVYRAPKRSRPRGKRIVHRAGEMLALTDSALFWTGGSAIVRRPRNANCDVYSEECNRVIARAPGDKEIVSSPLVDSDQLYALLEDGSVWRVPQTGGAGELIEGSQSTESLNQELLPIRRAVAANAQALFYVDFVRGAVVRREKSSNVRSVLMTGLVRPRAIAVQGESVFVLASTDAGPHSSNEQRFALIELDAAGNPRRKVELPALHDPLDLVATRNSVYVSFTSGDLFQLGPEATSAIPVFPDAQFDGYRASSLAAYVLAATDDALYFASDGQILELREGSRHPSVLVSALYGHPEYVAADARAVFFGHRHQHKWEKWIDLGEVAVGAP